ncbi:hypothetical protein ACA910_007245 [Epithemia clementina (nom. ined.)]
MSASHRSLARLPISLFQDLIASAAAAPSFTAKLSKTAETRKIIVVAQDQDDNDEPHLQAPAVAQAQTLQAVAHDDDDEENNDSNRNRNRNRNRNHTNENDDENNLMTAADLRDLICHKLQLGAKVMTTTMTTTAAKREAENGNTTTRTATNTTTTTTTTTTVVIKVKTVRDFFFLPTWTMVQTLDPLLTYAECRELERRIAAHCCSGDGATEKTAWTLLLQRRNPTRPELTTTDGATNHRSKCTQDPPTTSIPTGSLVAALDQQLGGFGLLSRGTVMEIVGSPGVGKSQLAFQLCLQNNYFARASGRGGGGAIYLDAEGKTAVVQQRQRLLEMAQYYDKGLLLPAAWNGPNHFTTTTASMLEQSIEIWPCPHQSLEELLQTTLVQLEDAIYLRNEQPPQDDDDDHEQYDNDTIGSTPNGAMAEESLLYGNVEDDEDNNYIHNNYDNNDNHPPKKRPRPNPPLTTQRRPPPPPPVSLIVLDSIAAPFRRDHAPWHPKSNALMQIAQTLKRLAHQLNLCVVVINQVATASSSSTTKSTLSKRRSSGVTTTTIADLDHSYKTTTTTTPTSTTLQDSTNNHNNDEDEGLEAMDEEFVEGTDEGDLSIQAALGTAWYHCVSTRIWLRQAPTTTTTTSTTPLSLLHTTERNDEPVDAATTGVANHSSRPQHAPPPRLASIVKSNVIATPTVPVEYTISAQGLATLG